MNYTYEQYRALYKALGGVTIHFCPTIGTNEWAKQLLSHQEFEKRLARLEELNSHDDEWLFENHPHDYMVVRWEEGGERFELRSDLFVIELERYEKIQVAMKEAV